MRTQSSLNNCTQPIVPGNKILAGWIHRLRQCNARAPYIEVVLKQDLVKDATQASEEDIFKFMQSLGFQQIGDAKFSNIEYIVADLHPRNVLKDNNGIIYVVDDVIFALNDL